METNAQVEQAKKESAEKCEKMEKHMEERFQEMNKMLEESFNQITDARSVGNQSKEGLIHLIYLVEKSLDLMIPSCLHLCGLQTYDNFEY
ncbi:hypothetical protein PTKIN_Ptkin19aG0080800 [Pterospermum kingtungense]